MVQGILIALIAVFAFIFIRGLRSGSSLFITVIWSRVARFKGHGGSVGLARKE